MNKLLYVSPFLFGKRYGGSVVSYNNFMAVRKSYPGVVKYVNFDSEISEVCEKANGYSLPVSSNKFKIALSNIKLYPSRLNKHSVRILLAIIAKESPTDIYFDSSVFGYVIKIVTKYFPKIKIISYFHNVEYDFEFQRLCKFQFKFFPSFVSVLFNERKTVKYSHHIISLHNVDSQRIMSLYGKVADFIIPVSCDNPKRNSQENLRNTRCPVVFGFLGSAFYANVEAAKYIKRLAMVFPQFTFIIAGRGFDLYKTDLSLDNLTVLGEIDSPDDFYRTIDVFISPIFSGAGMKVKISEAMSYNKPIIASDFSLIGYDDVINKADIYSVNTFSGFCSLLSAFHLEEIKYNNSELFVKYYSLESNVVRFANIWTRVL